ncbi:MAG TPA: bifunctional precorrin-2 dehydrogenase/sirohydrochlorin ferrochelatase [Gemmatimonadaceae bacterium]|nr:bifunctional precorrin-2 dehydrogenase/sirohydrochlorin ferrochelatase [Gemmatimonadaceae bacterium]
MSGYALVLTGRAVRALVVGGGEVAARKVRALLPHAAHVRVVAPEPCATIAQLALSDPGRVSLLRRAYVAGDVDDAELVFAATDARDVNARVAADARSLRRLVNVADDPDAGSFVTPAQDGVDPLRFAVTAGVPDVSRRILDQIVARFDARYARAAGDLSRLRRRLLHAGARGDWERAREELLGDDFCASVEDGRFDARLAAWR